MQVSGSRAVDPQAIESELEKVWARLHGDGQDGTVTRAAMSNLLVFCGDEQQAIDVTGRIAHLVQQHPARVLILALRDDEPDALQAWVSVHCRKIGHDRQLCAEHIELRFHAGAIERAVSVIRPLLIGDLPTALCWFAPLPPPSMPRVFEGLVELSQQLIYDSVGWTQPVEGLRAMVRWIKNRDTVVFSLAWRRLKSWRRMLTTGLDPQFNPGALHGMSEIEIVHGRDALPLAWLLIAWLAARLDWRANSARCKEHQWIEWLFDTRAGRLRARIRIEPQSQPRAIEHLHLKWMNDDRQLQQVRFCTEGHHLVTDEKYSCIPVITRPQIEFKLEQLVAAQMAHRSHDRLFMQVVEKVADMANLLSG